jgi:putative glutathione S-transferase
MTSKAFVATSTNGAFVREASKFRNWISRRSDAPFPAEKDRYHLYVSLACPWASRCLATMYMKGLDRVIGLSIVHPVFQRTRPGDAEDTHAGWAFADPKTTPSLAGPSGLGSYSSKGSIPDTVNNATFVRDLYELCTSEKTRYTVPLLWDKKQSAIVSNESADIVRMFNSEFNDVVPSSLDLYPEALRAEIDEVNEWIYNDISNGVYKCGFATEQGAYDEAVAKVFEGLDRVEAILSNQRYLVGDVFTEADLRLFTTLIRFDEVYYVHFKANKKLIHEFPNLSDYVRDLYQLPPIKRSVDMDHIKAHYYASHTHINAFGIIPAGPKFDYNAKHDRARFASSKAPTFQ